jgi:hypothetical protein
MSDTSHTVWELQRVALMRSRTVIFSGILELGGPPSVIEEERQVAEDARMAERMTAELREVLRTAGADGMLAGALPESQRDYWNARVPALLSFGARTHAELIRLAPQASDRPGATQAAAVFQLAASLLDWIGDEDGGAADIIRRVPPSTLECMVHDARARCEVSALVRREGRPATAAFVALLSVLIDLVRELPGDTDRFFEQLAVAYAAELASFTPPTSLGGCLTIARLKSDTPTWVVGELARLAATDDENDVVGRAVATISGIFGTIDDVADLSADLRSGAVNTLVAATAIGPDTRDDAGVARAMRALLATEIIEERSADVANRVHDLARMLDHAHVDPAATTAALEWLRTTTWRWIA